MRYKDIDPALFIKNRERFKAKMKENSIAIFVSNDMMPKGGDSYYPFRQNPDMFYLSGIDQEESILVLFPDCPNEDLREILFVKETNEKIAIWEGAKLNKAQATEKSGIATVQWTSAFNGLLPVMMNLATNCYLNLDEHDRYVHLADYAEYRFAREIKEKFPLHHFERSAPILHEIRRIKNVVEIELIQHACHITKKGFERVLHFTKPGVKEYEIEAEITHEFIKNGSKGHAYEPIIASGFNACVLHYNVNDQVCKDGDVILLDFGAEYANYASDMTRSIPVNGKFTKRQKEVYNAVLRVMKEATKMLKPGNHIKDYHEAVGLYMEKELVDLGLLKLKDIKKQDSKNPAYKKYFMHGTSHYLGIDVHDSGSRWAPMKVGNIFTCEPGIYIREENLGIRLENDILITEKGQLDLMADIPLEADEIEYLMQKGKKK